MGRVPLNGQLEPGLANRAFGQSEAVRWAFRCVRVLTRPARARFGFNESNMRDSHICIAQEFIATAIHGLVLLMTCLLMLVSTVTGQDLPTIDGIKAAPWNLKTKTLGGVQFWTDTIHRSGWRIQRNAVSGHYRLIDPKDVRHAWGSLAVCKSELSVRVRKNKIPVHQGQVVILLHGLMRSHRSMQPTAEYLATELDCQTITLQYASSREVIAEHAKALHSVIEHLGPEVTRIDFVAHSLGNLVVRHYLRDHTDSRSGRQGDPRIKRMVMLGPPNQGSQFARLLKGSLLFRSVAGASGAQLSMHWDTLEPKLATPKFEFGIIAGAQPNNWGLNNPILRGRDDFTVRLKETRLEGASDFFVQPFLHATIMKHPDALAATSRFLEHGYFVSAAARQPIKARNQP